MHYAQASTIALIGLDKLRQDVYGEDSYDFDYTRLDADFKPEDTDFRKRINDSSQGSLFD